MAKRIKPTDQSEFGGQGGMYTPTDAGTGRSRPEPEQADIENLMRIHASDPADSTSGPTSIPGA